MDRFHQLLDSWLEAQPSKIIYVDYTGTVFSVCEFATCVEDAVGLLNAHGVRPGDRVSLVCENSVAAAAIILACSRCNAWVNLINARITSEEIDKISRHAGARILVFTHQVSAPALCSWGAFQRLGKRAIEVWTGDVDAAARC